MWAVDMAEGTTRLQAAKATVQRFLTGREDDELGLVSFAAESLVRLPLTHDRYVVERAVEDLEVGLLLDGTDIAGAIAVGAGLLKDSPRATRILVLVTDGAHNQDGLEPSTAARAAALAGVRVYPIAIGTSQGTSGGLVGMETVLMRAAALTGGRYYRAADVDALDAIYEEIDRLAVTTWTTSERSDAYPVAHYLLLASLALLLLGAGLRASRWGVLP
jgi:Ca-activated chloride channel family protein